MDSHRAYLRLLFIVRDVLGHTHPNPCFGSTACAHQSFCLGVIPVFQLDRQLGYRVYDTDVFEEDPQWALLFVGGNDLGCGGGVYCLPT